MFQQSIDVGNTEYSKFLAGRWRLQSFKITCNIVIFLAFGSIFHVQGLFDYNCFQVKTPLLRGIYAYGFENPSAIQQRAILPAIKGKDVIAQAQSGTGKTATFAISILERINEKERATQALVMAPTRELALQIEKVSINISAKCTIFLICSLSV